MNELSKWIQWLVARSVARNSTRVRVLDSTVDEHLTPGRYRFQCFGAPVWIHISTNRVSAIPTNASGVRIGAWRLVAGGPPEEFDVAEGSYLRIELDPGALVQWTEVGSDVAAP